MDNRKWQSGAAGSAPAVEASPSSGYPTDGNPSTAVPATVPGARWFHQIGEELRNLISAAGLTPSDSDLTQLQQAVGLLTSAGSGIGKHTIWVPAGAMAGRITNGAASGAIETATNKVLVRSLDFDAAAIEYAQFSVRMPKSWNEGTVTAFFVWSNASGTGNVVWAIQAVAISDDDVLDVAFGTAIGVTDAVTAAGDVMQSDETAAITIAGTPANNDLVVFQVYRDATNGSDTLAVDARLHGVALIYTTSAATDA